MLVDDLYQSESRRVFATLIRLLGDFDLAEEALHDAFAAAVEQWSQTGVPEKPRAWLVSTGRFKAIDSIRSRARFDASLDEIARTLDRSNEKAREPNRNSPTINSASSSPAAIPRCPKAPRSRSPCAKSAA